MVEEQTKVKCGMYNEIRNMLKEKIVIEAEIRRLRTLIVELNNEIGPKATSYDITGIKGTMVRPGIPDGIDCAEEILMYQSKLENELTKLKAIEQYFKEIDNKMKELNDLEYKVFKLRYIYGMKRKDIAERVKYSLSRVDQVLSDIENKCL